MLLKSKKQIELTEYEDFLKDVIVNCPSQIGSLKYLMTLIKNKKNFENPDKKGFLDISKLKTHLKSTQSSFQCMISTFLPKF